GAQRPTQALRGPERRLPVLRRPAGRDRRAGVGAAGGGGGRRVPRAVSGAVPDPTQPGRHRRPAARGPRLRGAGEPGGPVPEGAGEGPRPDGRVRAAELRRLLDGGVGRQPRVRRGRQRRDGPAHPADGVGVGAVLPRDGGAAPRGGALHGPAVPGGGLHLLLAGGVLPGQVGVDRVAALCAALRAAAPARLRLEPRAVRVRHRVGPSRAHAGLHQDEEPVGELRRPPDQRLFRLRVDSTVLV
ncbi:MAG: hypothetical protein AVDCRST_MAG01-01-5244, partial [uncultured Rubrobacteraceae bacterium]